MKTNLLITCALIYFILSVPVLAEEAMGGHGSCSLCGMRRDDSGSRMLIEYDDGTKLDMCSMFCTAAEFAAHREKTLKRLQVVDFNSNILIDAKEANWVISESKSGVMTKRAKWAFEKREEAEQFIRNNGGRISTFDEVMKATFEDMYEILR